MYKFSLSIVKVFLFCLVSGAVFAPSASAQQDFTIQSEILQQTRKMLVHFPENYDPNSKEGYPVLYVLGPDIPDDNVAAQYDDVVAKAARDYYAAGIMPEAIVIGIRDGRRRLETLPHYYSVTRDGEEVFGSGDKLLAFIRDELIPFAGKMFRANGRKVFMGHSWAGQFLAYTLSQSPEIFDAYFITSPAFHDRWGEKTFNALKQTLEQNQDLPDFVYVSVGGNDTPGRDVDYEQLTSLLERHLPKEVTLYHEVNDGLNHQNNGQISQSKALKLYFSTTPLSSFSSQSYGQDELPVSEGPYLGQKPPGLIPEAFAPGIVSTEYDEFNGVFTPDLQEFYFIREGGKYEEHTFFVIQYKNNRWGEPAVIPLVGQPTISPDGKIMHFGRRYMERTNAGWSEVKTLGAPFKDIRINRLSASSKGTYYFDTWSEKLDRPIRYSRLIDGKYEEPRTLGKEINTGTYNAHPFIAPDESYLIWNSRREDGYGDADLYITFRQKDGSWGPAINMGDKINTAGEEIDPYATPDGKYLFFDRKTSSNTWNIYWVDAQIIENLRAR